MVRRSPHGADGRRAHGMGTTLRINTLASHRNRSFLRDPEEGGGGGSETGGNEGSAFTPIASQEEFDRAISRRLNSERAKFRDYETLKAKAEQFDLLARESQTDRERE